MVLSQVDESGVGGRGQAVLHALVEDVSHVASPFVIEPSWPRFVEGDTEPVCLLLLGGVVAVEERVQLFDHVLEDPLHLGQTIIENE